MFRVYHQSLLTLSLLISHICGVSKTFGEWYQKTNKTEDTNKLTLLAFKIIAILHNTWLATFIKLPETVRKCLFRNRSKNSCHTFLDYRREAAIQERSESRCALRLWYVDMVVSIEVAIEVCLMS
jgi:hypothetical protein